MYPVKYFKQVLLGKIFRPRTYVLLVLLGFVTYLYVKPVVAFSQEVHYKAAPWAFPFIVSNIYFIFLFMQKDPRQSQTPRTAFSSRCQTDGTGH